MSCKPSLIVSTSNNPLALRIVLEAFSLQTRPPVEILIADDGSGDSTTAVIEEWTRRLPFPVQRFWQPHEGFRKTIILNRAVRAATGNYLIFVDGDCFPHRRFVEDHLRYASEGAVVQGRRAAIREPFVPLVAPGSFHPLIWYARKRLYGLRQAVRLPRATVRYSDRSLVQGCNLGIWRDDFVRVNGYDETFSGWGHEDAELVERLVNLGLTYKTITGQLIVYHLDHPRSPRHRAEENERILHRTKAEKRTRCDYGLAQPAVSASQTQTKFPA